MKRSESTHNDSLVHITDIDLQEMHSINKFV